MATSRPGVEWRADSSGIRHAFVPISTVSLCGIIIGSIGRPGLRCAACKLGAERLATPAGQLLFTVFGTTLVSDETMKLVTYVIEERSKLATEMERLTARIDAIYKHPVDPGG